MNTVQYAGNYVRMDLQIRHSQLHTGLKARRTKLRKYLGTKMFLHVQIVNAAGTQGDSALIPALTQQHCAPFSAPTLAVASTIQIPK